MTTNRSLAAVMLRTEVTEMREFPLPEIPEDAGLLRIRANGICGSDWNHYHNEKLGQRILGHEMVGTIERIGRAAAYRWGAKEGDLVAVEEYLPCGHCEYCREGEIRSCYETDTRMAGAIRYGSTSITVPPALWGGYSQFAYLHPRSLVHRVPDGVPPRIAAMALPLGNGFQWAALDGKAGPGKTVVIQGPGQQGLCCVIAASVVGADLIIVSGLKKDRQRLELARVLGAHHTVMADEADLLEAVADITRGRMADLVIDTSGAAPESVNASMRLLRKRGILQRVSRKGPVPSFDADHLVFTQITLQGLRGHSFQAVEMALRTMALGRVPLERMSTHLLGLADVDRALRMVGGQSQEQSIHVSIDPWL